MIYFSTTVFGVLPIGAVWKRRYGVPFIVDYQDPWVSNYYQDNPHVNPPGGRLKYAIVNLISRTAEPKTLARCGGITSVSPSYPEQLDKRYSWFKRKPRLVVPFPGASRDLDLMKACSGSQQMFFSPHDGLQHWVYVGRGGVDMHRSLRGLFLAIADWRKVAPADAAKVRLHFIGTSYAPAGAGVPTIMPVAQLYGLGDVVNEITDRIPYSTMLHCLADAHALLMLGSEDPAYTASKLYPYLLANKPLLTIFHSSSSVNEVVRKVGGARSVTFDGSTTEEELAQCISSSWLAIDQAARRVPLNTTEFRPYTDVEQARELCGFFSTVLATEDS